MPRRVTLTDRQREALLHLPVDQGELLRHYTLSDEDLGHIRQRRRAHNRFGFALQLCVLRYPGRVLAPGELIPAQVSDFIAAQLGLTSDDLLLYAAREETRHEHLADLRRIYGYRSFSGRGARDLREWIAREAEAATSNEDLARRFVAECRRTRTILPGSSTIERLCADALVEAERRIEDLIAHRITPTLSENLAHLLEDTVDGRVTRFVWLRQFEVGANSAAANRLMDRLEYLQRFDLPADLLDGVPAHRVTRLRRQGERYYADGMRDLPEDRRLAILAVCTLEWRSSLADVIVETHDRIVGRLYRASERLCNTRIADEKAAVRDTLKSFAEIGGALLGAQDDGTALDGIIATGPGWERFRTLVATASALTNVLAADPLSRVLDGYHRFRLYAPRMLRLLDMQAAPIATPLLAAVAMLRNGIKVDPPVDFLRPNSKWHRHLCAEPSGDHRLWEIAVLFHIRDAFRSGDIWLAGSRRYGDLKQLLVPPQAIEQTARLAVPLRPGEWLAERRARLDTRLKEFGRAARTGTIPGGIIENGKLHIDKLRADTPEGAEDLVLDLYQQLPPARITDLLLEVDERTGFSEAFTHLRTGAPCSDRIGLMNVLLAEGVNLGLRKMAAATNTHSFWELLRIARWHVEGSAYDRALAMIVEAHAALPMAAFWGQGQSASSDGQFFLATEQGEAMNLINAKYGNVPGLKGYSHVSDQYAPFATQVIPATVSEAPYILDGLLMNDAGRRVRQHFADTGGFTDHVFAACALLGYRFAPRIRDLPQKRLYAFTPNATPANVRALVGGKINEPLIERNWPDILRIMATIAAGIVAPSQILRKLASYPRQNELALALREVGRIERTLFMIDWILDAGLQRQAQIGLNKGEAHHALKRAISFHRRGEIRDRSGEGQHYRIAGMNLLAAIIIFWNTMKLGEVVNTRAASGTHIAPDLLAHVSPLGWEHINLTGEYRWPKSLA
ncbi:TnpA family transposase [Sphingobium wenxiniae]|jgi:TnpA family transposase|uniref:Transposase Tn3 family protein n=7 Tax=Sphingomonadaceae TaxID=41297 RepID=F6F414_SPHCR|nr:MULTISPECIES: Tn3 family transposase [Sphingomonadaceae]MBY2930763.1 Tn3 family transposase [Sphingomonadales bacterium 56]MBY2960819.1 Tn3 family transposase [Sphingomonadales bacterium 58]HAZ60144.1 Tn3 family transposase [Gammaproteobacteria bacterium]AEG51673.1 transposase Tn3 family protein [Sphingobium chlorophenolicum L-1]AMK26019.1 Tn3 family transposase for insertion sequence element [Sphingobium sp. TKS]